MLSLHATEAGAKLAVEAYLVDLVEPDAKLEWETISEGDRPGVYLVNPRAEETFGSVCPYEVEA
jgi:hypothetical protein